MVDHIADPMKPVEKIIPKLTLEVAEEPEKPNQYQESLETGSDIIQKLLKRRVMRKMKEFIREQKQDEFVVRLELFLLGRNKRRRMR